MQKRYTLAELNALSAGDFVRIIGPVFEHSPWIASETAARRPFREFDALLVALCDAVRKAAEEHKLALIRAHPDLIGRAALAGTLTAASTSEQAAAGLNKLTSEEIALFQKQNEAYHRKFEFPFVICARLNKKEAILEGFARRLQNTREQEMQTAVNEIFKIANLRLRDLIEE